MQLGTDAARRSESPRSGDGNQTSGGPEKRKSLRAMLATIDEQPLDRATGGGSGPIIDGSASNVEHAPAAPHAGDEPALSRTLFVPVQTEPSEPGSSEPTLPLRGSRSGLVPAPRYRKSVSPARFLSVGACVMAALAIVVVAAPEADNQTATDGNNVVTKAVAARPAAPNDRANAAQASSGKQANAPGVAQTTRRKIASKARVKPGHDVTELTGLTTASLVPDAGPTEIAPFAFAFTSFDLREPDRRQLKIKVLGATAASDSARSQFALPEGALVYRITAAREAPFEIALTGKTPNGQVSAVQILGRDDALTFSAGMPVGRTTWGIEPAILPGLRLRMNGEARARYDLTIRAFHADGSVAATQTVHVITFATAPSEPPKAAATSAQQRPNRGAVSALPASATPGLDAGARSNHPNARQRDSRSGPGAQQPVAATPAKPDMPPLPARVPADLRQAALQRSLAERRREWAEMRADRRERARQRRLAARAPRRPIPRSQSQQRTARKTAPTKPAPGRTGRPATPPKPRNAPTVRVTPPKSANAGASVFDWKPKPTTAWAKNALRM